MEASSLSTSGNEGWAEEFADTLGRQRARIQEFLAAQQERLKRAEASLAEQLQHVADELAHSRNETRRANEQIQQRAEQLKREAETVAKLKEELGAREAEWVQLHERAAERQKELAEEFRRQQEELDRRREELAQREPEIRQAEARLRHDEQALQLARQEQQAEAEHLAELRERLDAREAEIERLDGEAHAELKQQLEAAEQRESRQAAELQTLRDQCAELERSLGEQAAAPEADPEELSRLQEDRNSLLKRLSETEQRLADAERRLTGTESDGSGETEGDGFQRRYEMAMEDLRELREKNAQLRQQLSSAPSGPSSSAGGGALDWEAEKQRILASLESDSDGDEEPAAEERVKIEEVVQRTERVLAEKDGEIEELRKLLEDQSSNLGSMAVGAAALGEILDNDAIVLEERKNLKALQEECREKLRKAEIDISLERAKIARERAQIDEKLRMLEMQGGSSGGSDESPESKQPPRGRWLARLGLKDLDEPEGK